MAIETDRTSGLILQTLKARGSLTAASLAGRLSVTPVAVRQHLDRLLAEGLVRYEDRRETVGRPKRYWALSEKGHNRFPDNHEGLTLEMLDAVRSVFGEEGLEKLICEREARMREVYGQALTSAGGLKAQLEKLAERRTQEGYMAEVEALPEGGFRLVENHCPICSAARKCQGFCRSELALFRMLLGPDVTVEREEHIIAGARRCAYLILPVKEPATSALAE
ncbi:winged helix-turn-helix transcriptional regulator [Stappia sp. GBMRC 2046]|uniref:Winged helix-turn-helix transcriptional regulator n=1 Tax=Stappia sediminis TaxID=2692190 RepID=A0A7X3S5S8_9HYPH|nr:metalloregulator ArsR/SmtB family transcription factor [Stappia sediminis]MXN63435.1 winged helix-turn-helix transcriptional regulator [Stappia sediminis]